MQESRAVESRRCYEFTIATTNDIPDINTESDLRDYVPAAVFNGLIFSLGHRPG